MDSVKKIIASNLLKDNTKILIVNNVRGRGVINSIRDLFSEKRIAIIDASISKDYSVNNITDIDVFVIDEIERSSIGTRDNIVNLIKNNPNAVIISRADQVGSLSNFIDNFDVVVDIDQMLN